MIDFFPDHPYWAFMDQRKSSKALIYGTEYLEFLANIGPMGEAWKLTPIALTEPKMRQMLFDSLGVDSQKLQYELEHALLLNFKDRGTLLAFVLKFRDALIDWRRTE